MAAREVEPVVVLGLGRFGRSVALALTREGCEVLAIDQNADLVREVSQKVTMAVEADVTSKEALEQLGVGEYTRAVVAMGDAVEASLVCALVLKEDFKIPEIWAKAINAQQAKDPAQDRRHRGGLPRARGRASGGSRPAGPPHRVHPHRRRPGLRRAPSEPEAGRAAPG